MSTEMPKEISQNLASWVCGELGGDELGGGELGGGELGGVELSVYAVIYITEKLSSEFNFSSFRICDFCYYL